jgi:uncharacterized 2Fe-2S/4Fe-4S cluster protein (DUF4445 family)
MAASLHINERPVLAVRGASLFDCAEGAGIQVPTSCNKQGKCRECLVEVEEGEAFLTPKADEEAHLTGSFRLACRTRFTGDAGVVRCHTLRRGTMRVVDRGARLPPGRNALDPAVRRRGRDVFMGQEVVAQWEGPLHGVAMDLGTTTIVLRLYDLETGELVASSAFENPQRFGGSDVMARIHYDGTHPGRLLQRVLAGYLSRAIDELPSSSESIFEIVVAGNTTMRDLFFGLPVESIGQKPYRSVTEHELRNGVRETTSLRVPARRLRIPAHPQAWVYGIPLVSSHVGADAASGLLATGLAERERIGVFMDIGTNTELMVGNRERLLAASCPAGPAFEGGRITCGMPGLEGAIERVRIAEDGGMELEVIGGGPPRGICGSGLVELLSELRRREWMNEQGRFTDDVERCVVDADHGIFLSEADVNELAQAKGANMAGVSVVLSHYGATLADVERLYLAGGFGGQLSVAAARRIGLIPDLPDEEITLVGNASIEGAAMLLRSVALRRELESIVGRVEHVALESHPDFFDAFVEGCQFRPFAPGVRA